MIRITIDLLPFGSEKAKIMLARAKISNNLTGTVARGNYDYSLWKKGRKIWRKGKVENFPRNSYGIWKLLYLILKDVFE